MHGRKICVFRLPYMVIYWASRSTVLVEGKPILAFGTVSQCALHADENNKMIQ
jgi:hypothetical protein